MLATVARRAGEIPTCLFVSDTRLARNVFALLLGISIQKTKLVL